MKAETSNVPVARPIYPETERGALYGIPGMPELVLRTYSQIAYTPEEIGTFTTELMRLSEYGIFVPGVSTTRAIIDNPESPGWHGNVHNMLGAEKIHGVSFEGGLAEIPVEIAEKACAEILRYYADVIKSGGTYITDLRPDQLMYGHTANDPEDKLYFADLDPLFDEANGLAPHCYLDNSTRRWLRDKFPETIEKMEAAYGRKFEDLREELSKLQSSQPS